MWTLGRCLYPSGAQMSAQPSYTPVLLLSLGEICKTFGVGTPRVRQWVKDGAPIAVELNELGEPVRYRAELLRLYVWLEENKKY